MTITHHHRARNRDHDQEPVRGRHYRHNQPRPRSYQDSPRPYPTGYRAGSFDERLQTLLDTTLDRYRKQYEASPEQHREPVIRYRERFYRNPFLYPTGELARRTAEFTRAREAQERIPKDHLPQWRIKCWLLWKFIPLVWLLKLCRDDNCPDRWPCGPIRGHVRHANGWRGDTKAELKALSSRRRRAKAAARIPGAVSHRRR